MGIENFEEFRPITPIRTTVVPITAKTSFKHVTETELFNAEKTEEHKNEVDEECCTPTSPTQTLRIEQLVCPPAPKKPRLTRRNKNSAAPPCQGFFQVTHDLASVFVIRKSIVLPNKIKASS